ncbi:2-hydroxyacyl-CoA dehydratase [Candidatus Thorarchaeota archaeon]|nr:MAG: 2-hydroxyacyl-CoA dehydratase [Candidatus Thorarchaeota archaeon]
MSNQGVIEQSDGELRQLIEAGEELVGYIYPHTPLELVLAHGLTPSLIRAVPGVPSGYEASLQTFACSYVRNLFSLRADEQMPQLAAILFPSNTCDSLQNVGDLWRIRFPNDRVLRLTYPVSFGGEREQAAVEFLAQELRLLSERLETLLNRRFSQDSFERAVSLVTHFRNAAGFLYAARAADPHILPYADLARLTRSFLTTPTGSILAELDDVVDGVRFSLEKNGFLSVTEEIQDALSYRDVPSTKIEPKGQSPRVLVAGGMVEPESVGALVNGIPDTSDSIIATDLLSFGFKSVFTHNVQLADDPFHEMAKSILSAPGEPTQEGLRGRMDFLSDLVRFLKIDGVILFEQSFCDPDQFEAPSIERSCRNSGVRTTRVPIDPELSDRARMEVRIQSFLESIGEEGGGSG